MTSPEDDISPIATLDDGLSAPGSRPLRNSRHERFCRARSMLRPKIESYRYAFEREETGSETREELHALRGNASKLERRRDVQDRIAFLCRDDVEALRDKRRRLEERLWLIHDTNYADYWHIVEREDFTDAGEPTGHIIKYLDVKPFASLPSEHQQAIESLKYTEKGRPILSLYSKMQANIELRKLLGIGIATREGDDDLARMSDGELAGELKRLAAETGLDVSVTARAGRPCSE